MSDYDVAIVGGGPSGSTLAGFLLKHDPSLRVAIFEREKFPRDHVGESLLPRLMRVLDELGVWDKVEAAGFPVKVGAVYRWGSTDDTWSLDFLPPDLVEDQPRPAAYAGQRTRTAFQVDRSIYDKILLDHVQTRGCRVFEETQVVKAETAGDRVAALELSAPADGKSRITAQTYVDASGNSGIFHRAFDIGVVAPNNLRNIAIWDYWQNAEWAERIGVGGTRIQVLSVGWGWLWFIPLGPTRTSLGLVTPAEMLRQSGKTPEELYMEAVNSEPTIVKLTAKATRENILHTTKDWNFISDRLTGENWYLAGDSTGFADPILSAGCTLAQTGARKVAFSILEERRGEIDPSWIKRAYTDGHKAQVANHIAFADYWYTASGHWQELEHNCSAIARKSGLKLTPESAFIWLATGGFAHDEPGAPAAGAFRITGVKKNIGQITGEPPVWEVEKFTAFKLNLDGAARTKMADYVDGRVVQVDCWKRGNHVLPLFKAYGTMVQCLEKEEDIDLVLERFMATVGRTGLDATARARFLIGIETLEALLAEGWVKGSVKTGVKPIRLWPHEGTFDFGWLKEGIGIVSVDPAMQDRVAKGTPPV